MKMSQGTYEVLASAVSRVEIAHPYLKAAYQRKGLSWERYRWDLLHRTSLSRRLYDEGLKDDHIDTALRRATTYEVTP